MLRLLTLLLLQLVKTINSCHPLVFNSPPVPPLRQRRRLPTRSVVPQAPAAVPALVVKAPR